MNISRFFLFISPFSALSCYFPIFRWNFQGSPPSYLCLWKWKQYCITIGYPDVGAQWRSTYEHPRPELFQTDIENLWLAVKPLYQQLHAYVRHKLKLYYSDYPEYFPESGHMPLHVLGTCTNNDEISSFAYDLFKCKKYN